MGMWCGPWGVTCGEKKKLCIFDFFFREICLCGCGKWTLLALNWHCAITLMKQLFVWLFALRRKNPSSSNKKFLEIFYFFSVPGNLSLTCSLFEESPDCRLTTEWALARPGNEESGKWKKLEKSGNGIIDLCAVVLPGSYPDSLSVVWLTSTFRREFLGGRRDGHLFLFRYISAVLLSFYLSFPAYINQLPSSSSCLGMKRGAIWWRAVDTEREGERMARAT